MNYFWNRRLILVKKKEKPWNMKCVNRSGILVPSKTVLSIPMTRRKQEQRTCHLRLVWNLRHPKYLEFLFKNVWHRDPCLPTIHPKYDENYKNPIWTPTFIFWLLTGNDKGRRIIHYKGSYPYNPEVCFSKHTHTGCNVWEKAKLPWWPPLHTFIWLDNKHMKVFLRSNH